jgi:DNA polymerase
MVTKKPSATAQLEGLREKAAGCTDCPLYANATQTVFGEGSPRARIMVVGEQPGDVEDREGHPFVGPAGRILDQGLAEAGIARRMIYVTNAVKHFKWEPRGKRRLHKSPAQREIDACYQSAELSLLAP